MQKGRKRIGIFLICILLFCTIIAIQFYFREKTLQEQEITTGSSAHTQDTSSIFQDETTGLYGLSDADGKIIASAEWKDLYFIGDSGVAAVKQIGTESVTGVLDQEGNVIVPFVYQDLSYVNDQIIVGKLLRDDRYFLYDNSFHALTSCAWNAYILKDSMLTLQRESDSFVYRQEEGTLVLQSISLQRSIQRQTVTMYCENRHTVSLLSVELWTTLGDQLSEFLKTYQRNDETAAEVFLSSGAREQLQSLLTKNTAEKWLVDWSASIPISRQKNTEGESVILCAVTVKRETESAILQITFPVEKAAGTLQITGLELLQEEAEAEESVDTTSTEESEDFVIDDSQGIA